MYPQAKSADSYYLNGQFGQAQNISGLLKNMKNGFFIECGAADGESLSNSLLFEMRHQWTGFVFEKHHLIVIFYSTGLLIEANPYTFAELRAKNRK